MKVLLINPTTQFEILGSNPAALEESRGHNPPLGILLLAGYLEKHSDHTVSILDTQAEELTYEQIAARIRDEAPDVAGITTMTQTLLDVLRIVEIIKAQAPQTRVVLGGPHVHLFPEETIRLPGVDYLVLGEGERTFKSLLDNLDDQRTLKSIPALVFQEDGRATNTGMPAFIEDLDALPFPARHLTDVHRYDSVLSPRHPVTTMFTSRGCPFKCRFCDRPHLGKRFRARSANNVVAEFEQCLELGIPEFLIYDDTFTVQRDRVIEICREIGRRDLDVGYDIRTRVDTVDPEVLKHLAASGCRGIHYGVEAGTDKVIKALNKRIDLETVAHIFRETRAAGMQVLAYFMIGSPSETRADIRETFRMTRELDPDFIHLTILTPYPGTAIYEEGLRSGVLPRDVWREFAARPHMGFVPPHWPEFLALEELEELLVEGYRHFYRRPRYLIKRVLKVRSAEELARKTKAGVRILTMRGKKDRGARLS